MNQFLLPVLEGKGTSMVFLTQSRRVSVVGPVLGRKLRRLLIDPFVSSTHRQLSLSSP
jgi:hypothetical protein